MRKTRLILSFVLVFLIAITSAIIFEHSKIFIKNTSALFANECVIIIDAGHGNFDGGAVANDGTIEKDLNLNVAKFLDSTCKANGLRVYMVRSNDSSLEDDCNANIRKRKNSDLRNRVALMQKYQNSIYISIHMNKFSDTSVHGAQIFYTPNFVDAKHLADSLRNYVNLFDETNTKAIKKGTKDAYILYDAKCPAIIYECGFMSNREELSKLKETKYQQKIAFSIYLGILEYFNTKEK